MSIRFAGIVSVNGRARALLRELRILLVVWGVAFGVASMQTRPAAATISRAWTWYTNNWDPPTTWPLPAAGAAAAFGLLAFVSGRLKGAPHVGAHNALTIAGALLLIGLVAYAAGLDAMVTAVLVTAGVAAWRVSGRIARSDARSIPGLDSPISSNDADVFGRGPLVDAITKLVSTRTPLHCPKLAVCAPVGHGKTSLCNLVRARLASEGFACVWVEAWHHTDRAEATRALRMSVDDALSRLPGLGGFGPIRRLARALGAHVEPAWARALMVPVAHQLALSQDELTSTLRRKLPPNTRLVLFVDDLERADPFVARDLLLYAHEIVANPALAYVFAFDRDMLIARAKGVSAFDETLLDKVFDRTFDLPPPSDSAWLQYDESVFVRTSLQEPLRTVWSSLTGYLPRSPRRRARFALFVLSWPGIEEPLDECFDRSVLILLLLLEFARPGTLGWLRASPQWLTEIENGHIRKMMNKANEPREEPALPPEWEHDSEYDVAFRALREHGHRVSGVLVREEQQLLPLDLHIDCLGGKAVPREVSTQRRMLRIADRDSLADTMAAVVSAPVDSVHMGLLKAQDRLSNELIEATQERRLELLATLHAIDEQRRAMIARAETVDFSSGGPLRAAIAQLYFFSQMRGDFTELRERQIATAKLMLERVNAELASAVSEIRHNARVAPELNPLVEHGRWLLGRRLLSWCGQGTLEERLGTDAGQLTLTAVWTLEELDEQLQGDLVARFSSPDDATCLDALAFLDAVVAHSAQPWSEGHWRVATELWRAACALPATPRRAMQLSSILTQVGKRAGPAWDWSLPPQMQMQAARVRGNAEG